ncbi:MAG: hypothetical protein V3U43_06755, partial [Pseudomonadales bacterium]
MSPLARRVLLSLALVATVGISWSGVFDDHAVDETRAAFKHALVAFGTARALNGAISVVQGTELALQPVGLGVTLAVGQVLDPLNDLMERFSWVMLMCAVSLGAQIVVQEVAMSAWSNWALSIAAFIAIVTFVAAHRWRPASLQAAERSLVGFVVLLIFLRFIVAGAAVVSHAIGEHFLNERRDAAVEYLVTTQSQLEELDTEVRGSADAGSWLETIAEYAESRLRWLNIEKRLQELGEVIERAVEEVINLMVVFT